MSTAGLLRAWKSWDTKPKDEGRANRMEDAVQGFARTVGATGVDVRQFLSSGRRVGLSHEAIALVLEQA